jgi:cytochrome c oxidase cbb3-type subunit 1
MHPYYIARAFGGSLFLIGALVATYNIWMTVRTPAAIADEAASDMPATPAVAGE